MLSRGLSVPQWEGETLSLIEPGTLLGRRYRVVQSLSFGGFGETFQVIDEACATPEGRYAMRVLKVLNLSRFYDSKSRRKSIDLFRREAKVLSQLRHPGIPTVESDGYFIWPERSKSPLHCLIMEYIEGRSLDAWLRLRNNKPIDQDLAIAWLRQLLGILDVIHAQGLIHRDIKPSNIMLTASGQLVLIDFGAVRDVTATYLQGQSGGVTNTRIFAAGYTPHEQAEGRAKPESDFFALGRTFVHLMTGIHPMSIEIDEQTGKLAWREDAPQIATWLADLLDRLMEPFPGNRPPSAQHILAQLQGTPLQVSKPASPSADPVIQIQNRWTDTPATVSPDAWANTRLKRVMQGHRDQVRAIAITPDSNLLVSSSFDQMLKVWSLPDAQLLKSFEGQSGRITTIAINAEGTLLASGGYDRHIRLWSLPNGELQQVLPRQSDIVQALVFHPQKPMLISATGTTVQAWATQSANLIQTLPHQFKSLRSLAISPDGRAIAVGSLTGLVELWNIYSRQRIWQTSYQAEGTTSVSFSPKGTLLACATGTSIELLDLNKRHVGVLHSRQAGVLTTVAFSPDGHILASASDQCIELWGIDKRKRLSPPLTSHQKRVRSLAFTPNGRMLVSAGSDQKILLWQPAGIPSPLCREPK